MAEGGDVALGGAPATGGSEDLEADKPLKERLKSKNQSTRANALVEVAQICKESGPNDEIFSDLIFEWKTLLADSHPNPLEKALDALPAFIDRCRPSMVA